MGTTKTMRNNRRRQRKIEKYLRDRMKETMFPLAKSLADELGDIEAGTLITMPEFKRCLFRIADIRSGKVKKPI